jgi:4-diphosphocytidyl-2-C-methyl-D-erythritol kinase
VRITAPAKINLTLDILGRRPDGYHELRSVVTAVDLCDELEAQPRPEPGVDLTCTDGRVPSDRSNLVWRAAERLARSCNIEPAVRLRLAKTIPPGAGLGGGSSDAAAAMLLLARWWHLQPGLAALSQMAADLGSDVPFFLRCGTALITGRGETVQPMPYQPPGCVLLIMPPLQVSTAEVYSAFSPSDARARPSEEAWEKPPASVHQLSDCCYNSLRPAAERVCPALASIRSRVERLGLRTVHLSGSGSAMFVLLADRQEARQWADRIAEKLQLATYVGCYFGWR